MINNVYLFRLADFDNIVRFLIYPEKLVVFFSMLGKKLKIVEVIPIIKVSRNGGTYV